MWGRENKMYTGYLYGNINYALVRMQLIPQCKGFLENLTITQPIKKFPELYGTQSFHYLFTNSLLFARILRHSNHPTASEAIYLALFILQSAPTCSK